MVLHRSAFPRRAAKYVLVSRRARSQRPARLVGASPKKIPHALLRVPPGATPSVLRMRVLPSLLSLPAPPPSVVVAGFQTGASAPPCHERSERLPTRPALWSAGAGLPLSLLVARLCVLRSSRLGAA